MFSHLNKRLDDQHPGNGGHGDHHQQPLDPFLSPVHVGITTFLGLVFLEQDHVDERDQDRGCAAFGTGEFFGISRGEIHGPLHPHEQGQVPKHA